VNEFIFLTSNSIIKNNWPPIVGVLVFFLGNKLSVKETLTLGSSKVDLPIHSNPACDFQEFFVILINLKIQKEVIRNMKFERVKHLIVILIAILFASGCGHVFEHDADVQARNALKKLITAQAQFNKDNGSYARHVSTIEDAKKYDIEYHKGVVYLEMEEVYDEGYRAISLPAESITARVFAFDSKQGGYYEMKDAEVSRYVLGALKHIRKELFYKAMTDLSSIILMGILIVFGIKSLRQNKEEKQTGIYTRFFISIAPLAWSLGTLNHMNEDTHLSWVIHLGVFVSLSILVFCLLSCVRNFKFLFQNPDAVAAISLTISMFITSVFSLAVIGHTLYVYYF
jgi:hypothetical protein